MFVMDFNARLFLVLILPCISSNSIIQDLTVSTVEIMEGGKAELPCDVSPPRTSDRVSLILWFKEEEGKPIYSVEVPPGKDLGVLPPQAFWSSSDHFASRAEFRSGHLIVSGLKTDESGTYRCRVDFNEAQTRSNFIHLTVVEPVEKVVLKDEVGEERMTFVGPYLEGQSLNLTCIAFRGSPVPWVEWWRNRMRMESTLHHYPDRVESVLTIQNLSRTDLHSELGCKVNNNNISASTNIAVHIDMNLSPTSVDISGGEVEMIVGRTYTVTCTVEGSRPPPVITWFLNSERLEGMYDSSVTERTVTRSELKFEPRLDSVGGILMCRAVNPVVPDSVPLSAEMALNISYAPHVDISLGKSISANTVFEGGDVYFDCDVDALPPSNRISWIHNGIELKQEVDRGIIFTNFSLVLQKISRERSGSYVCEAGNRIGRGQSKELILDVKYVPVCQSPQPMIYGVSKRELVNVLCEVEANPADVEFRWTFNNTAELIRVPQARPFNNISTSLLSYTPITAMDYGTLMCSARNQVGSQKEPCVFHIIMAVTPDPVENCTVINKSSDSFHLQCIPGFDGGMNQTFHIVVKDRLTNNVKYDNSNLHKPDVIIKELKAGEAYLATVTSFNKKGTSLANQILVETLQHPETQLVEEKLEDVQTKDVSWQVAGGILAGIFVSLVIISVVGILIKKKCEGRRGRRADTKLILENTDQPRLASVSSASILDPAQYRGNMRIASGDHLDTMHHLDLSPTESLVLEDSAIHAIRMEDSTGFREMPGMLGVQRMGRKGILKKNVDSDNSDCDTVRKSPMEMQTSENCHLLERKGRRRKQESLNEDDIYTNYPVRSEKDGLLPIHHKTTCEVYCESSAASEPFPPPEDMSSLSQGEEPSFPLEISASSSNLSADVSCSHTLKRKKQESMV